jgi:predicted nuclease with RNAse H fold
MPVTAACIDITGSDRAMDVAFIESNQVHLRTEANLNGFISWVSNTTPEIVAVDAPSKENIGLVPENRSRFGIPANKYANFRIAEAVLKTRQIGLYNTPMKKPPEWMKRGWDLYSLLQDEGYSLLDQPGRVVARTRIAFEVHPHASFVVGLGWIPQKKSTLAGLLERAAFLRREFKELELSVNGTLLADDQLQHLKEIDTRWDSIANDGIVLPSLSHDQLDALAGLVTAVRVQRGEAEAIGHQDDGVIVIPKPLSETPYQWKHK